MVQAKPEWAVRPYTSQRTGQVLIDIIRQSETPKINGEKAYVIQTLTLDAAVALRNALDAALESTLKHTHIRN